MTNRQRALSLQKGSILEPLLILVGLSVILVFFILPASGVVGPAQKFNHVTNPDTYNQYAESNPTNGPTITTSSAYTSSIYLGQGNASYSTEPSEEYVTIENHGSSPINLTGWKLKNNTANRTYYSGNQAVHYGSTEVTIPQAAGYIAPPGSFGLLQNVVLQPGESAVVNTGITGVQSPYKITNFKENECSGCIEALPQYDFTPPLSSMCVSPSREPGIDGLDSACKTFISGIGMCQTPTIGTPPRSSEQCDNCVNGRPAPSSACLNFIKAHFSYQGCLNYHANDPKFYGTTWRIFLGQKWELWNKEDEVISLFDQFGKLAAYKAY